MVSGARDSSLRSEAVQHRREPSFPDLRVVVLQHDSLDDLSIVIVAPLVRRGNMGGKSRVAVESTAAGETHAPMMSELAAVRRRDIGDVLGSVEEHRDAISRAVDAVFFGL